MQTPPLVLTTFQEGNNVGQTVAAFTDTTKPDPTSFLVNFGDNTAAVAPDNVNIQLQGDGLYHVTVTASHNYVEEGTYGVLVTFTDTSSQFLALQNFVQDPQLTNVAGSPFPLIFNLNQNSGPITVASFTDPAGPESLSNYSAMINWGDGSPTTSGAIVQVGNSNNFQVISSGHTYNVPPSSKIITVTIQHDALAPVPAFSTATIQGPALAFVPPFPNITAVEGQAVTGEVARFTDNDGEVEPGTAYTAMIDWGDGTPATPGTVTPDAVNPFLYHVSGAHVYAEESPPTHQLQITVLENNDPINSRIMSAGGIATVTEAPLVANGVGVISGDTAGLSGTPNNALVATFIDTGGPEAVGNYSATINWGDFTPNSVGAIVLTDTNVFEVHAPRHVYQQAGTGTFLITVTITHGTAPTVNAFDIATVNAGTFTLAAGANLNPVEGTPFTGTLATFRTQNPLALASNYSATIDWGDGSANTPGVVTKLPNPVVNGGFEGSLFFWNASSTGNAPVPIVTTAQANSGSFSALLGTPVTGIGEPLGNSTLTQNVTVPQGTSQLTFFYFPFSTDSVAFDQQQVQIRNAAGNTILATILNRAGNEQTWIPVSFDMTPFAGQTVQLYFNVHQDGAGDPTAMYIDDVSINSFTVTPVVPHLYLEEANSRQITVTVTALPNGPTQMVTDFVKVADAGITVTLSPNPVFPVAGTPTFFDLGFFRDQSLIPEPEGKLAYTAFIFWGDGQFTTVSGTDLLNNGDGTFEIRSPHTYTTPFVLETITVFVLDNDGGAVGSSSALVFVL
jgi:hypothetical protein